MDDGPPLSVTVPLTASPMRLPVLICDEEQQGAQSSTGVTPRLTGVSLAADMPPWVLMQPSPSAKSPSSKSPRSSAGGSSGVSKTPRLSDGADAPSSLRTSRDLDADVEADEAVLLEGAEDSLTTATGAEATAGQGGSKSVAAPGEGRNSSDDDDDDDESGSDEDDMLQRLTAAAMRRGTQSPRRSAPTTPIAPGSSGRKSTPRLLTKAASTEGGEPVEEGWDAVAPRRRATTTPGGTTPAGGDGSVAEGIASSAEGGSAPHSAGPAAQAGAAAVTPPATGSGGGAGSACPVSDNEDDAVYDAYSAAKDGSRRRIGKHGRNAREARSREFSMQARGAQRAGAS